MGGRILREGHACEKPSNAHKPGTIWQCDCGRYWAMTSKAQWTGVSSLEVSMMRLGDAFAAAQKVATERAATERAAAKEHQ